MRPPAKARRTLAIVAVALLGGAFGTGAAQPAPNRAPILVLVSFDGWRWDYTDRLPATNLRALASRGVRARALIPSFPVLTFPNHHTIVTGLYPEHHGVVGNRMTDGSIAERFTQSSETAKEALWWGGEPVWVTAIRQGLRAFTMFWPGTEAPIAGVRPTEWRPYDKTVPNAERSSVWKYVSGATMYADASIADCPVEKRSSNAIASWPLTIACPRTLNVDAPYWRSYELIVFNSAAYVINGVNI